LAKLPEAILLSFHAVSMLVQRLKKGLLGLLLLAGACQVMLIGAYDSVTDQSIQKIQNETMTLLVRIGRNFDQHRPDLNHYDHFTEAYENLAGEVESLRIRCQSIPTYSIILEQVNLLDSNLHDLEKYHQAGFTHKEELDPIRKAFESQFSSMITLQNSLKRKKTG
jgi:hypothetical protein